MTPVPAPHSLRGILPGSLFMIDSTEFPPPSTKCEINSQARDQAWHMHKWMVHWMLWTTKKDAQPYNRCIDLFEVSCLEIMIHQRNSVCVQESLQPENHMSLHFLLHMYCLTVCSPHSIMRRQWRESFPCIIFSPHSPFLVWNNNTTNSNKYKYFLLKIYAQTFL